MKEIIKDIDIDEMISKTRKEIEEYNKEENIKRIEEILKYKNEVAIPLLCLEDFEAIECLLQAYKEDKAVIKEMAGEIQIEDFGEPDVLLTDEEVEEYFRNKVKGEK